MINVFAVFTGKLLQTLQRFAQFCNGTVILTFLKFGDDKRFCCFYWKTATNTAK